MNLRDLEIPQRCADMIRTCERYYHSFYLEMVRMSNASFSEYCKEYLELLLTLSKQPDTPDVIRSAIGVVCMDKFGYHEFADLARIIDRLVPQVNFEYAKFTSWCIGRVVHHPDLEKSRFVSHLFRRLLSWTHSAGRRARPLAAATLLESLSANAGSIAVSYFEQFQSDIWKLVSHSSLQLQKAIARAISMYTRALIRYGRSDLNDYLKFFMVLCSKLLCFGDPMREMTALSILEVLLNQCPSYFVSSFLDLFRQVSDASEGQQVVVVAQAYVVLAGFSKVDAKQFVELFGDEHFDKMKEILFEFPLEITNAFIVMCDNVPEFMLERLHDLHACAKMLTQEEPECTCMLLSSLIKTFGEKAIPDTDLIKTLLENGPMSEAFNSCFVALMSYGKYEGKEIARMLSSRMAKELLVGEQVLALKLLAKLPLDAIAYHDQLFTAMNTLLTNESVDIRKEVPAAMFRLGQSTEALSDQMIFQKLLQCAIFEQSLIVRSSVLETLCENPSEILARPEFINFFKIFVNDDSSSVRKLVFLLLSKIAQYNPMSVTALTRKALLDSFFILRHVPSIREKSRVVRCLPNLIKASALSIRGYSDGLMDILMDILASYNPNAKFEHFLEEDAQTSIMIGALESLALLAPLDPKQVAKHGHAIVDLVCDIALKTKHRLLAQWVFHLLFALLSAPGSDIAYRAKTPLILSTCSTFLASTRSRKARMVILKVLGAIGCLEAHQRSLAQNITPPANVDEELSRQFYTPNRDVDGGIDETLLISDHTCEQYFSASSAIALLDVFKNDHLKEFYDEVVRALVQVLQYPRMHMLEYFDAFMVRFLDVLEKSTDAEMAVLLPSLTQLVSSSTHNTSPFLKRSLALISERFCSALADPFLDLIIAFLTWIRDGFAPYASQTICLLVGTLDEKKTTDAKTCTKVLQAFTKLSLYAADLVYLIVPQVSDTIVTEQTLEEVRINSLNSLREIAESVDLYPYLGPMVRGIYYSVHSSNPTTCAAGFNLLYTILKSQGLALLTNAGPLLESLKNSKLETEELRTLVSEISKGKWGNGFKPLNTDKTPPPAPKRPTWKHVFSEDTIVARIEISNVRVGRQMEHWFRSFILTLISNSPSAPIRACITLATSYYPLGQDLFNAAFFSCWREMSPQAQNEILKLFAEILRSDENYETVARSILNLFMFMDRIERPLNIPTEDIVKAAVRYGHLAYALHLLKQEPTGQSGTKNESDIPVLVDLLVQLGDWASATSVWKQNENCVKKESQIEILRKLQLWDRITPMYREHFERTNEYDSFIRLIESLAAVAEWSEVMKYIDAFEQLEKHQKLILSPFFAEAALNLGQWDKLIDCLEYCPDDSERCLALSALAALYNRDYSRVTEIVERAFSLLASRPIKFWADNQQIHKDTMIISQELVEIREMSRWVQHQDQKAIEESWSWRLLTAPREFETWKNIIGNRVQATGVTGNYLVKFFELRSPTLGTELHAKTFECWFPEFNFDTSPDVQKLAHVVTEWNVGKKEEALRKVLKLTQTLQGELLTKAQLFSATWLLERDTNVKTLKQAYCHLKSASESLTDCSCCHVSENFTHPRTGKPGELVIPSQIRRELTTNTSHVDVLRKWSDVNIALIQHDERNKEKYVINGVTALSMCISMWPSFPDVVQLLNLFFENANNKHIFQETCDCVKTIQSKLLLQAAPQIFVKLGDPNEHLRTFLHDLVFEMLDQHYHDLVFSILVLKFSKHPLRASSAKDILARLHQSKPEVPQEVKLIRSTLLRAAVTWSESIVQKITDAFDYYQRKKMSQMVTTLNSILSMTEHPKCEMHEQFIAQHKKSLKMLRDILKIYAPGNSASVGHMCQWCSTMQNKLEDEVKKIRTIQLSSVSAELCDKNSFVLAVPGTYRPGKPVNHIKYFVGQFSVYVSKQQPKDVIIKGEDGNFYQYLLKGHEDLRLDERIMQFFRLINSIMVKDPNLNTSFIQTVSVIPLSMSHGLVQWATGTDTLRAVVEQYRRIHEKEPLWEYEMIDELCMHSFDFLQPIQKMQLLDQILAQVPDNDIADFLWIKAPTSETWWKQTTEFTTSTAMMSIVGYVIGLGDRHPSNLLLNKFTGKVVHIDFGDCFERAARRKFLPEVVPFRLTRMIVKALGPGGVGGLFRSTFVKMSTMLRNNRQVLEMVLAIFVHEPLSDPNTESPSDTSDTPESPTPPQCVVSTTGSFIESGRACMSISRTPAPSTETIRVRIHQKLTGTDMPNQETASVEEQATWLINAATDPYNISKMYSGWCPFW